jgi:hypothetical protein
MLRRIHVNAKLIRWNLKHNEKVSVCRVQEGSKSRYCNGVVISGPSVMVYRPDKPLSCGAKVWIETESPVVLIDETTYSEIRKKLNAR